MSTTTTSTTKNFCDCFHIRFTDSDDYVAVEWKHNWTTFDLDTRTYDCKYKLDPEHTFTRKDIHKWAQRILKQLIEWDSKRFKDNFEFMDLLEDHLQLFFRHLLK